MLRQKGQFVQKDEVTCSVWSGPPLRLGWKGARDVRGDKQDCRASRCCWI